MEAIDAFFGQNWVDQAQREHPIHPNGDRTRRYRDMSTEDVAQREEWAVITWLMTWAGTEQGYWAWRSRHHAFLERTQDLLR